MKTSRLSRVLHLLTALQSGQPYAAKDLAGILKISRRMVFRDLNELRKAGVPCSFNNRIHCYVIDPAFFLPAINLDARQALGLLLLVYKAGNHIHFPFKGSTLAAALKIENNLPDKIRRYCNAALPYITIKPSAQETGDSLDQTFARLVEAILKKRLVNIRYYSPLEQKDITTVLHPYHLMYDDLKWYVFGKSSLHNKVCPFRLNYIRSLNILEKCFVEEKEFDVYEYLGRAWSMIPEGRLYNVRLRFLPEVARSVAEVRWHNTQTVAFQDDGSIILEFLVDGLNEIIQWVLSYGDQVQVLAPAALRQRFIKIAQNEVRQNTRLLPV
jgi:proteasome accessory factor B